MKADSRFDAIVTWLDHHAEAVHHLMRKMDRLASNLNGTAVATECALTEITSLSQRVMRGERGGGGG